MTAVVTPIRTGPVLTIQTRPGMKPVRVTPYIFRSWTGRRFVADIEVHGPVFTLGQSTPSDRDQARACPCRTCQSNDLTWITPGSGRD